LDLLIEELSEEQNAEENYKNQFKNLLIEENNSLNEKRENLIDLMKLMIFQFFSMAKIQLMELILNIDFFKSKQFLLDHNLNIFLSM
jgi:hypothetical protein